VITVTDSQDALCRNRANSPEGNTSTKRMHLALHTVVVDSRQDSVVIVQMQLQSVDCNGIMNVRYHRFTECTLLQLRECNGESNPLQRRTERTGLGFTDSDCCTRANATQNQFVPIARLSQSERTCLGTVTYSQIHGMDSVAVVQMERKAIRQQNECISSHGFTDSVSVFKRSRFFEKCPMMKMRIFISTE
jgi:hypothetical protein